MWKAEKKFSVLFIAIILSLLPLYGVTYSIKSDSMIIYTGKNGNRTKFFNDVKFKMDSTDFTSKFAEMFEDSLFLLSDSVRGRKNGDIYETDSLYFYPKTSIAKFVGQNRFIISGSKLEGNIFVLDLKDSSMVLRGNVRFVSKNDSIMIKSQGADIDKKKRISFYNTPVLTIREKKDTVSVKSDTISFYNDSTADFMNNLIIKIKGGSVTGDRGKFYFAEDKGIITGQPHYVSEKIRVGGDTMKLFSDSTMRTIIFYNNAEMEYNKKDYMSVRSDSIEIDLVNDSIKTVKAFGEVDGNYKGSKR